MSAEAIASFNMAYDDDWNEKTAVSKANNPQ